MTDSSFVQFNPKHVFYENEETDYSLRDQFHIQSLKAIENLMDIDAYIIDYINRRILYATKDSFIRLDRNIDENTFVGVSYLDNVIFEEDLPKISVINSKVYEFVYSLPIERRLNLCFTQDFRIKTKNGCIALINHKGTILDLQNDGTPRLTLCVYSTPTNDKPGNSYIKITDSKKIYEFMSASQKFVEVKTQKLTSKATKVLKLASNGKNEVQIAETLGISLSTVKYHKQKIFSQLGVKNTAEAIQWLNNQKKMIINR